MPNRQVSTYPADQPGRAPQANVSGAPVLAIEARHVNGAVSGRACLAGLADPVGRHLTLVGIDSPPRVLGNRPNLLAESAGTFTASLD